MVSVQVRCSLDEAMLKLTAMAEATDATLEHVAEEVTSHRVTFGAGAVRVV